MRFCTAINCMDGRVQLPVIRYLQKRFNVEYVDSITEAGPSLILATTKSTSARRSILQRLRISVENHQSVGVAIVGHHDCAGNTASRDAQILHIRRAKRCLSQLYGDIEVVGLWVDHNWQIHEIVDGDSIQ